MRNFDDLFAIAADRKGGSIALDAMLPKPKSGAELSVIPDDRWLAQFSQMIFNAGFNWKVVESMWPGFEAAFQGFDVGKVAMMDDTWFDSLLTDTRIVRYGAKIRSVQENAVFLQELAAEHGSAAQYFAQSQPKHYATLLDTLKRRGSRLGGNTGAYALRYMGVDGYILSTDVVARLVAEGVVDKTPTSKKAMTAVQEAFNEWQQQSGRSLTEISRVLAMSIG